MGGLWTDWGVISSPFLALLVSQEALTIQARFGLHRVFRPRIIERDRIRRIAPSSKRQLFGSGVVIDGVNGERWIFFGFYDRPWLLGLLEWLGYPVEQPAAPAR